MEHDKIKSKVFTKKKSLSKALDRMKTESTKEWKGKIKKEEKRLK